MTWMERAVCITKDTQSVAHTYHHVEYHRLALASSKTCENVVSSGQTTYHVGRGAATISQLRSRIEYSKQLLLHASAIESSEVDLRGSVYVVEG